MAMLLFAPTFVGAVSTTAAAETPAATVVPSSTVTDSITQATASEALKRAALGRLEQAGRWHDLAKRVTVLEAEFDALALSATPKAESLKPIDLDRQLRSLDRAATATADDLALIVRSIEHDGNALESDARNLQERLLLLEKRLVPAPVLEQARSIAAEIQRANVRIREYRDNVLLALNRALALQARIDDARALLAAQQERLRMQRMQLEQSPLWQLGAAPARFELVAAELRAAWRVLRDYLVEEGSGLAGVFFGVLVLTAWLFIRRNGEDVGSGQRAYGRPLTASLLVALMLLWWLAPDPPILFRQALAVLVPIPAAMIARRAFAAPIPLTLYGVAFATMLLPMRGAIEASPIANRVVLLLQVICVAVPVAIDLIRGRLEQVFRRAGPGPVRTAALLVIVASAVTAFHVIFGFTGPARLVRTGMGSVLGFGLVFGTTAVVLYGATLSLLSTPFIRWLRSARNADPALLRAVRLALSFLAIGGVVVVSLGSLGLIPTIRSSIESLMGAKLEVGTVSITAKAVVMALAVAFATFVLTGVAGFVLDREVVPRLHVQPGAGYAIVTFARWFMFIVGAVLTLAALGIDLGTLTLLAGALGVGIGFGLQNVVNNFVSGLILIVERPVGVGDEIEGGTLSGKVTRIGIRSSTVRTAQGADVIVPNGELVSKEVVNWTRSDRRRRYDIDIRVAPGSEPEQVMRLLVQAAREVPEISTDPAPAAMFKGFDDSSLNFTLFAWVPTVDVGLQAQNALRVAILRKLGMAGIAIPFPQRDEHIPSADDDGARQVTG